MEKMYSEMQKGFSGVNERLDKVEKQILKLHMVIKRVDKLIY